MFLAKLQEQGVRFVVVGLTAAVLQGADTVTQAIDLWFESISSQAIPAAAVAAGGFFSARMQPPMVGGHGLDRIDVVTQCDGLASFDEEYRACIDVEVCGLTLKILPLERVLHSKQAANRPKDRAVLEQLRAAIAAQHTVIGS